MALSMMERYPSSSWNWPCQAMRQFFHIQWMQSIEANIPPSHPCSSLMANCLSKSTLVGFLKYWLSHVHLQHCLNQHKIINVVINKTCLYEKKFFKKNVFEKFQHV